MYFAPMIPPQKTMIYSCFCTDIRTLKSTKQTPVPDITICLWWQAGNRM